MAGGLSWAVAELAVASSELDKERLVPVLGTRAAPASCSCAELAALAGGLFGSDGKLACYKAFAHAVADPQCARVLEATLTFSSDKEQVRELFAQLAPPVAPVVATGPPQPPMGVYAQQQPAPAPGVFAQPVPAGTAVFVQPAPGMPQPPPTYPAQAPPAMPIYTPTPQPPYAAPSPHQPYPQQQTYNTQPQHAFPQSVPPQTFPPQAIPSHHISPPQAFPPQQAFPPHAMPPQQAYPQQAYPGQARQCPQPMPSAPAHAGGGGEALLAALKAESFSSGKLSLIERFFSDTSWALTQEQFARVFKSLTHASDIEKAAQVIGARMGRDYCAGIAGAMAASPHSSTKMSIIQSFCPHVADLENVEAVLGALTHASDVEKAAELFGKRAGPRAMLDCAALFAALRCTPHDSTKMAIVRALAPRVVDRHNRSLVLDAFSFGSSKNEAAALLA